jgi:hypothetical protein
MPITIDAFTGAGYKAEELATEVWLVEDFVSGEEIKSVFDFVATKTDEDWLNHYMDHLRDRAEREFGTRDVESLSKEGKFEITFDWADKTLMLPNLKIIETINKGIENIISYDPNLYFKGSGTIQRQYEGSDLKVHVDNHVDPHVAYACVIYLNDDYNYGEVIFPEQGLELKPKPGSMLFFSSGESHPHGVNPPGAGPFRYVIPCFIHQEKLPEGFIHTKSDIHLKYKTRSRAE